VLTQYDEAHIADIQIYGDQTASNNDCFKMFNPVDKTTFEVCKPNSLMCISFNGAFCLTAIVFPHQRVINKWCMAFLILFEEGLRNQLVSQGSIDNWVPIGGDVAETTGVARKIGREQRKLEGLDLGMQELRTYFRLFMLSTFLLMFMFCTRISSNRQRESGNIFST
jgi:hypothetical protein